MVETVLRDIQEQLIAHNYSCSFQPVEHMPLAYIDYKQTSYCIRNIILGTIDGLENGHLNLRLRYEEPVIDVMVEDMARVLSEDELEAMLTPFAETHEMGSGLNLALCRNMLEKQNIPFLVVAPPTGGVIYTIKLPTHKEDTL
jgi:K+-sensing histidine kinase KdpD